MKRRDFLRSSSAFSLPILLNGMGITAVAKSALFNHLPLDNDKVLILIYMGGGNDGLNTLIPLNKYDVLANVRPDIILPESSLLSIDGDNAFHSSMTGFQSLYNEDKLGIIQGVAYPNQNRSHFRSTDVWNTGSDSETYLKTGWFGRYIEHNHPEYPVGYPNTDNPDPLAMTIDYSLSETCQGTASNYSLALVDPSTAGTVPEAIVGDYGNDCYGDEYKYILDSIEQSNLYSARVIETYENGTNISTKYPDDNRLAQQLKTVAKLISGGSQTKIFILNQGGYDTHANQVEDGDHSIGTHATLLQTLSDAICAFQDDISQLGYGEKVLGMTYSEFGRRIRSNVSLGSDHGTAAPLFLFGECVAGGTLGNNPEIDESVDGQAGLEMQYDYRSIYASVLIDWFDMEPEVVGDLLFKEYQYLPILKNCAGPVNTTTTEAEFAQMDIYPNPNSGYAQIKLSLVEDHYTLKVYSILGSEVKHVFARKMAAGDHVFNLDLHDLPNAQYILRISGSQYSLTKRFVKI